MRAVVVVVVIGIFTIIIEGHRINKARLLNVMLFDRSSIPHFVYGPHKTHARPLSAFEKYENENHKCQLLMKLFHC